MLKHNDKAVKVMAKLSKYFVTFLKIQPKYAKKCFIRL